jgi:hypothetical protein
MPGPLGNGGPPSGRRRPRRTIAAWSDVRELHLTSAAIQASAGLAEAEMRTLMKGHRMARVATAPVVYGMCRMWITLISETGIDCTLVRTRDEALEWLRR